MLQELKILNGELSLEFDPLNTKYTVIVNSSVKELQLEYIINEEDTITIAGNNLNNDYNEVIITVYNDKESTSYYLYVYKEKNDEVNYDINYFSSIETPTKEETSVYAVPIISSICFIIILLTFSFLFRKSKVK